MIKIISEQMTAPTYLITTNSLWNIKVIEVANMKFVQSVLGILTELW
jgi:hypothetical protein